MIKLPSGVNLDILINDLRILSWEAAEVMLNYSKILKDSNYKSNILQNDNKEDPVTIVDLKVNELIIKRIKDKYSDIYWGILSEENVKSNPNNSNIKADWIWVLDPLDGTKDFIQGTGNYAMHLALNYKQIPYIGIVLIPEKDELWITDGEKTWGEKRDGSKIKTSNSKNKLLQEMILVNSRNHANNALKDIVQKINFREVIVMGSIGCKIASIIRGETDIYISLSLPGKSSPKDWDFAAPEAILKAAGGRITNLENEDLSYGKLMFEQRGLIIATNDNLNHEKICLDIKKIIKDYDLYAT